MGMPDTIRWTRDQVLNLPADGNRYELVDGELIVSPSPALRHQVVLGRVYVIISSFVTAMGLGQVLWSPADLELEPGQVNQPDVFVLPRSISSGGKMPRDPFLCRGLSPSTARYDRGLKRRFYQRAGVAEYWIIDIDAGGVVERWRPGDERPEILDGKIALVSWHTRAPRHRFFSRCFVQLVLLPRVALCLRVRVGCVVSGGEL